MSYQNISVTISPVDKLAIQGHINAIKVLLPFLINLTPQERRKLRTVKQERISYVQKTNAATKANPQVMPSTFDQPEYDKDAMLLTDMNDIKLWLSPLAEGIEDTLNGVGNEAMRATDEGYAYLKTAAKKSSSQALTNTVAEIAAILKHKPKPPTP